MLLKCQPGTVTTPSVHAHATHPGVGNDKLDSDSPGSWDRGNVKRLVINTADNETKRLADGVEGTKDIEYTLGVAWDGLGNGDTRARLFLLVSVSPRHSSSP